MSDGSVLWKRDSFVAERVAKLVSISIDIIHIAHTTIILYAAVPLQSHTASGVAPNTETLAPMYGPKSYTKAELLYAENGACKWTMLSTSLCTTKFG